MAATAIGASQGYQTMATTLNYLTYRTFPGPKTHELFKTIIIFKPKFTRAGGKQTNVTTNSKSNDF